MRLPEGLDETFWRDRPDVLVKSQVAGHGYTIQMPRDLETERSEHGETFSIHGRPLVEIAWTTPGAATQRVMKGARDKTTLTKLGFWPRGSKRADDVDALAGELRDQTSTSDRDMPDAGKLRASGAPRAADRRAQLVRAA